MVRTHPIWTYALALALIATQVAGVGAHPRQTADTNGDRQVDVRDVQTVVTQVLNGLAPDRRADVNNDGRIDVLDLQRVLARATEARAPKQDRPADTKPKATVPAGTRAPAPAALAERYLPTTGPERPVFDWPKRDRAAVIPTDTERYLFGLTPHAPPVCVA